ncbi:MAG: 7-cyano-7-deazaguanine synthase [archaeon]
MKEAIILVSGGLDSYVTAWYAKKVGKRKVKLLFFDYGQKGIEEELFCTQKLAGELKARLKIVDIKWLGEISTSLINKNKKTGKTEIIKWYVPCRNAVFLTAALAYAESEFLSKNKKSDIYLGVKYEGEISFNDTKEAFIRKVNELSKVATQKGSYKIVTPFIKKDKEEIINLAKKMGLDLEQTYSCYRSNEFARVNNKKIPIHCGDCAGCKARKKGFRFSEIKDPSIYVK